MIERGRQPLQLDVVSRAVAHICDITDPGEMTVAIAGLLTKLIPCDVVWRTRLDLARGAAEAVVVSGGAVLADELLTPSMAVFGTLASPAFSEASSASRGGHQLSMVTKLGPEVGEGWILVRQRRDFSAADVDAAHLLLSPLIAMDRLLQERGGTNPAPTMDRELSVRELEVLAMVSDGLTAAAIGRRLGIAPGTVRKHLERVYRKFGLHDRLTAVTYARDVGLIPQGRRRTDASGGGAAA